MGDQPSNHTLRKIIIIFTTAFLAAIVFRFIPFSPNMNETPRTLTTLQSEDARDLASQSLTNYCKKYVAGFKQVVDVYVQNDNSQGLGQGKWRGKATVDFTNYSGDITRTNLHLYFKAHGQTVECRYDSEHQK